MEFNQMNQEVMKVNEGTALEPKENQTKRMDNDPK